LVALRPSKAKTRIIILLTDGDSNVGAVNPITASILARQEKIKIYTIGIGKADRVLVPIYSHDPFGRKRQLVAQVPSYLNPTCLKESPGFTGGQVRRNLRDELAFAAEGIVRVDGHEHPVGFSDADRVNLDFS